MSEALISIMQNRAYMLIILVGTRGPSKGHHYVKGYFLIIYEYFRRLFEFQGHKASGSQRYSLANYTSFPSNK